MKRSLRAKFQINPFRNCCKSVSSKKPKLQGQKVLEKDLRQQLKCCAYSRFIRKFKVVQVLGKKIIENIENQKKKQFRKKVDNDQTRQQWRYRSLKSRDKEMRIKKRDQCSKRYQNKPRIKVRDHVYRIYLYYVQDGSIDPNTSNKMSDKISQALVFIKKARDQSGERQYVFARDNYIKGLQLLNVASQNQKQQKKRNLIREQMDVYLKEAQQNNQKLKAKGLLPPQQRSVSNQKNNRSLGSLGEDNRLTYKNFTLSQDLLKPKPPLIPTNHANNNNNYNFKKECSDKGVSQFILTTTDVDFNTIVGMKDTKKSIQQIILLPKKRPDLFTGIRAPPRGIIMYGPPGNGKTFMAKAIATESGCTFFNLSASSLMSKYVGDSEKMLKRIFAEAYKLSPSIIFIDEIDSILTSRSENQNEASRRLKTQFLVQMDGLTTTESDSVLCIGATNLPKELDKAALRRFPKKIYVGPPDFEARKSMLKQYTKGITHILTDKDYTDIAQYLECYSASDIKNVAKQASMIPVRELGSQLMKVPADKLRKVNKKDFFDAIKSNPPTLSKAELLKYGKLD